VYQNSFAKKKKRRREAALDDFDLPALKRRKNSKLVVSDAPAPKRFDDKQEKVESFKIDDGDLKEGNFDDNGFFVFGRNKKEDEDPWLASLTKEQRGDSDDEEEDDGDNDEMEEDTFLKELQERRKTKNEIDKAMITVLDILQPRENVLMAIRRLKDTSSSDKGTSSFDTLIEAADLLIQSGFPDIYADVKEKLASKVKRDDEIPLEEDKRRWEYKWEGKDDLHGPFDTVSMIGWFDGGYFGEGLLVREEDVGEFKPIKREMFAPQKRKKTKIIDLFA